MDYPFGHPNHRPDHQRRDEEEYAPPPPFEPHRADHHRRDEAEYAPPPPFEPHRPDHHRRDEAEYAPPPPFEPHRPAPPPHSLYDAPPPPHVTHVSHFGGEPNYAAPPPPYSSGSAVQHVSHESENNPHHHRPHMPSSVEHHPHQHVPDSTAHKPSVRVYSKAEPDYSLSIRDDKVILVRSNPSDPHQHWIKDEKWSTKVKDEQGYPSFALVNKATGLAIKHAIGATHPVRLVPYNPDIVDESVLWTESKDLGDGYRTIRMVNNIKLNVDAFNGDENHGGVHDGTTIVLWEWKKGANQRWNIVPY